MITTGQNLPETAHDPEVITKAIAARRAKNGRPCSFTPELAAEVIERLQAGETLRAICRDSHMPVNSVVYDWVEHVPAFASAFSSARKRSGTSFIYEGVDILDDMANLKDLDGKAVAPAMAEVRLAEARANYRMNLAKILDREAYGERQQQGITCGDITLIFGMSGGKQAEQQAIDVTNPSAENAAGTITYEIPG